MPNYYEVFVTGPIVMCDDWTMPVDKCWYSYVVIPQDDEAYNSYQADVAYAEQCGD